jgi:hypothetical protein
MNNFMKKFLTISVSFLLAFVFASTANAQNFGIINSTGYGSGYGGGYGNTPYGSIGYNPIGYGGGYGNNYGNSNYGVLGLGFNTSFAQGNNLSSMNAGLGFNYGSGYGSGYGSTGYTGGQVTYSPIYSGFQTPNYYGGYNTPTPYIYTPSNYAGINSGYGYGSGFNGGNNSYTTVNAGFNSGFYW